MVGARFAILAVILMGCTTVLGINKDYTLENRAVDSVDVDSGDTVAVGDGGIRQLLDSSTQITDARPAPVDAGVKVPEAGCRGGPGLPACPCVTAADCRRAEDVCLLSECVSCGALGTDKLVCFDTDVCDVNARVCL